jgi:hypothetical protein
VLEPVASAQVARVLRLLDLDLDLDELISEFDRAAHPAPGGARSARHRPVHLGVLTPRAVRAPVRTDRSSVA